MKAFQIDKHSQTDLSVKARDIETPSIGDNDVLVKVKTAGVNPLDNMITRGEMKLIVPYAFPLTMGNEMAVDKGAYGLSGLGNFATQSRRNPFHLRRNAFLNLLRVNRFRQIWSKLCGLPIRSKPTTNNGVKSMTIPTIWVFRQKAFRKTCKPWSVKPQKSTSTTVSCSKPNVCFLSLPSDLQAVSLHCDF